MSSKPLSLLYLVLGVFATLIVQHSQAATPSGSHPVADSAAVVAGGQTRFSVPTPRLIRMEWSSDGSFEDHATLLFLNRRLSVPRFAARTEGGWLIVQTASILLRYKKGSGRFQPDNLEVTFPPDGKGVTWHPGMPSSSG